MIVEQAVYDVLDIGLLQKAALKNMSAAASLLSILLLQTLELGVVMRVLPSFLSSGAIEGKRVDHRHIFRSIAGEEGAVQ